MILNPCQQLIQLEDLIPETAPVAMIRQDVATISQQNNLEFNESYDDLDFLVYATLTLHPKSRVGLVSRKFSPTPGIEICVRHDEPDIAKAISETLYELNLTPDDLIWVHGKYKEEFYKLIEEQSDRKKSAL